MSRPATPKNPESRAIQGGNGGACPYQFLKRQREYLTSDPSTAKNSADTTELVSRVLKATVVLVTRLLVLNSTSGRE